MKCMYQILHIKFPSTIHCFQPTNTILQNGDLNAIMFPYSIVGIDVLAICADITINLILNTLMQMAAQVTIYISSDQVPLINEMYV